MVITLQDMGDVTSILEAVSSGNPKAAHELFSLVYDELRIMASQQMLHEKPGQTLQPTALVHEAFVRLINHQQVITGSRRYFFAAAGEAMRRILIEQARRKKAEIYGGKAQRIELVPELVVSAERNDDLLAINEALDCLHEHDPAVAELVKLRYFVGMTIPEVAQALDISPRTADAWWAYARAWLREALGKEM